MNQSTRSAVKRCLLTLITGLVIGLVTACAPDSVPDRTPTLDPPTVAPSPSPNREQTSAPTAVPTATPVPPKELTICQREEPNTLFIYGGPSRGARNVLDAIYDGPIGTRDYAFEAAILERVPSLERGDAALRTVYVGQGERVLGADGKVVDLLPGVTVSNPEGQEAVFEGDVISVTQMVVTFTLRADVTWADGEPLTSEDSWFSYDLAGELDDATLRRRLDRTASYEVQDSQTIVWTGVPGYRDAYYTLNFYHPLPRHVMRDVSVEQLPEADMVRRRPLGWGPFAVESWAEGDHITMVRNPHYFRASEGLPYVDRVTFRFIDDARRAMEELIVGECDLISEDLMAPTVPADLLAAAEREGVRLISGPSNEWEHLDFGIQPARWSGRLTYFDDRRVRQAVAHCVDRERIAAETFPYADAAVAHSYVLPQHPVHAGDQVLRYAYDPILGRTMLEEAGWRDTDGDGILEAHEGSGVAAGTVFSTTLLTTQGDAARQRAAGIIEENLADCGIDLDVDYVAPDVFYADGPDGPVFGRQFDLALFSWLNGLDAPCALYLSSQIPTEENWWATSNNPGYANEAYDAACQTALGALYGSSSYVRAHQEAQRIFSEDLPVLPMYFVPRVVAVAPGVQGVALDPSQRTPSWAIETMDVER